MKEKLFNLNLFNPDFAVFPKPVFKEKFDFHYFLTFNDWFSDESDYKMLQVFLEAINEPYLYCAVPDFYNCPDIKVKITDNHSSFIEQYCLENQPEHPNHHIGLRISPTGFWYGQSSDWAMVSDLTNNIIIAGLKPDAALNFRADFGGKYFGIKKVIQNMEEFHHTLQKSQNPDAEYLEMDNKSEIIKLYF